MVRPESVRMWRVGHGESGVVHNYALSKYGYLIIMSNIRPVLPRPLEAMVEETRLASPAAIL